MTFYIIEMCCLALQLEALQADCAAFVVTHMQILHQC